MEVMEVQYCHNNLYLFRVCLVLGSGGHTTEMMALAASLDKGTFRPRSYIVAETDQLSRQRVTEGESLGSEDVRLISVPR